MMAFSRMWVLLPLFICFCRCLTFEQGSWYGRKATRKSRLEVSKKFHGCILGIMRKTIRKWGSNSHIEDGFVGEECEKASLLVGECVCLRYRLMPSLCWGRWHRDLFNMGSEEGAVRWPVLVDSAVQLLSLTVAHRQWFSLRWLYRANSCHTGDFTMRYELYLIGATIFIRRYEDSGRERALQITSQPNVGCSYASI